MTILLDKPVTCPILIGRTREVAALASLIDGAREGLGRAALIRGESGIGKSRLTTQAQSAALAHGFLILQAECFPADSSYPGVGTRFLQETLISRSSWLALPLTTSEKRKIWGGGASPNPSTA
jgi:AAA ATPase domain